jgi:hypothetical protein
MGDLADVEWVDASCRGVPLPKEGLGVVWRQGLHQYLTLLRHLQRTPGGDEHARVQIHPPLNDLRDGT